MTHALTVAGYGDSKVIALHGEEGIVMLQRLQKGFNFGDGEDDVMEFSIQELKVGHYVLGVEVENRDGACASSISPPPWAAHSFGYFGTWVNERLTRTEVPTARRWQSVASLRNIY